MKEGTGNFPVPLTVNYLLCSSNINCILPNYETMPDRLFALLINICYHLQNPKTYFCVVF